MENGAWRLKMGTWKWVVVAKKAVIAIITGFILAVSPP
jgi:hypothetical protein